MSSYIINFGQVVKKFTQFGFYNEQKFVIFLSWLVNSITIRSEKSIS